MSRYGECAFVPDDLSAGFAIQSLLLGLGVDSMSELHRLVERGRAADRISPQNDDEFRYIIWTSPDGRYGYEWWPLAALSEGVQLGELTGRVRESRHETWGPPRSHGLVSLAEAEERARLASCSIRETVR